MAGVELDPPQDWVDALMAGVPEPNPNPHYYCGSADPRPCPTGKHTNPYVAEPQEVQGGQ